MALPLLRWSVSARPGPPYRGQLDLLPAAQRHHQQGGHEHEPAHDEHGHLVVAGEVLPASR